MPEPNRLCKLIDLHCHILPEIDDGAKSLKESLAMAQQAVDDGIHTIVATPHTLDGSYQNTAPEVRLKVTELQRSFQENEIPLTLCVGADVHLCADLLEQIRAGEVSTINDTGKYILLEIPHQTVPARVKDEIFALKLNGITPIISHPERHPIIQHDLRVLSELVNMGALCQITAMSITGEFGEIAKVSAEKMLKRQLVHIIASDAHSPDDRPPILTSAVEAAAEILDNYNAAYRMVTDVPSAILAGDPVEFPEPT
ncbi:tyrosine-protein phosphatase [Thermodesulfobacteriota bacterium]